MKRFIGKNKKVHIIILLCCLSLIAISFLVNLDRTASSIVGPKWHLRSLDQNYQNTKTAFTLLQSMAMVAQGRFKRAFDRHPLGPIFFGFIIFEVLYRIYAMLKKGKIAKDIRKIHFISTAVIAASLITYTVWDIWGRG